MVGEIKKWLGVDALERENLVLAKAVRSLRERVDKLESAPQIGNNLTPEPSKPKIVAKPQRANWKQFRTAAERVNNPEREEA